MKYTKVFPRDLFNEANLLKCLGKLTLAIEDGMFQNLQYVYYENEDISIGQDEDGNIFAMNIEFYIGECPVAFKRPLNSRQPWPLFIEIDEYIDVFNDDGSFTEDFLEIVDLCCPWSGSVM